MKKLISVLTLIALLCSLFSVAVFAEDSEADVATAAEEALAVDGTETDTESDDADSETEGNVITEHGAISAEKYYKHIDGELVDVSDAPCAYDQVLWRIIYEDGWYQETSTSIDHKWDDGVITTEPTCTSDGVMTYTCTVCGAEKTEKIKGGHEWASEQDPFDPYWGVIIKEPSCTETGLAQDICLVCGETREKYRTIEMLDHIGEDVYVLEALPHCYDETRDGELDEDMLYTVESDLQGGETITFVYGSYRVDTICMNCGEVLAEGESTLMDVDQYVELFKVKNYDGHEWDGWVVEIAPTCTEDGSRVRVCKHCGAKQYEVMPALGHTYEYAKSFLADCFHRYDKFVCAACGDTIYGYRVWDTAAKKWDYSNTITEEEFEADPTAVPTVETESHVYPAPAQQLLDEGITTIDYATFQEWTETDAKKASKDFNVIKKDKIVKTYIADFEAPTCTEDGWVDVYCIYFEDVEGHDDTHGVARFVVPALGHTWTAWEIEHLPGDGDNEFGTWVRSCTVCGAVDRVSGKYTPEACAEDGHTWVETGRVEPTCTEEGMIEYLCNTCGETKTEVIDAAGHTWDEGVVTAASCDEDGYITYTCTVCGAVKTEEIPATGHVYDEGTVVAPTCTEDGYTLYTCTVCGATKTEAGEAATGHEYTAETVIAASCAGEGTDGKILYTCSKCGDIYVETVEAPEHVEVVDEAIEPAIGVAGRTEGSHCAVCGEVLKECEEIPAIIPNTYALDLEETAVDGGTSGTGAVSIEGTDTVETLYARVTWVYTLANGDSFAYCAMKDVVDNDGVLTFNMVSPKTPYGATLDAVQVALVTDANADASGTYTALAVASK